MKVNRTTLRALDLLEIISRNPNGYTLKELVEITKNPKSSVHDIIVTLVNVGAIEEKKQSIKRYYIGDKTFKIGARYLFTNKVLDMLKPYLIDLSMKINKTILLSVEVDKMNVYIYNYGVTDKKMGFKYDLCNSAAGKILLANMEESKKNYLIEECSIDESELEKIVSDRYFYYKNSIGIPITFRNKVIAAIEIVGETPENMMQYEKILIEINNEIQDEFAKISLLDFVY